MTQLQAGNVDSLTRAMKIYKKVSEKTGVHKAVKHKRVQSELSISRHKAILEFIGQFCKENKYCPTIREIGDVCGITSTSVTNYYLDQLRGLGFLDYVKKQARTVHLTEEGELEIAHRVKMPDRAKVKA